MSPPPSPPLPLLFRPTSSLLLITWWGSAPLIRASENGPLFPLFSRTSRSLPPCDPALSRVTFALTPAGKACHKQWHQSDPIEMRKGWRCNEEERERGRNSAGSADSLMRPKSLTHFLDPPFLPDLPSLWLLQYQDWSAFLLFRAKEKGGRTE